MNLKVIYFFKIQIPIPVFSTNLQVIQTFHSNTMNYEAISSYLTDSLDGSIQSMTFLSKSSPSPSNTQSPKSSIPSTSELSNSRKFYCSSDGNDFSLSYIVFQFQVNAFRTISGSYAASFAPLPPGELIFTAGRYLLFLRYALSFSL